MSKGATRCRGCWWGCVEKDDGDYLLELLIFVLKDDEEHDVGDVVRLLIMILMVNVVDCGVFVGGLMRMWNELKRTVMPMFVLGVHGMRGNDAKR